MAPDKSLAAEIEAVKAILLAAVAQTVDDHGESMTALFDRIPSIAAEIAAEIAALQSRAFEDGARDVEVREIVRGLEGVADFLRDDGASPAEERCVRKAASLLAALFLQPEGERNA